MRTFEWITTGVISFAIVNSLIAALISYRVGLSHDGFMWVLIALWQGLALMWRYLFMQARDLLNYVTENEALREN